MPSTSKPKVEGPMVYLVRDVAGEVYGVFASEKDAVAFAQLLDYPTIKPWVQPRTLYYGQPPNRGYNQ